MLLNDDTEVISANWIETLVGLLQEPDVGMVGPMLVLADGRVQSAGHHYAPTPMQLAAGAPVDDPGPHAMFTVAGERTGVTAACAALRRDVYDTVGGLSERFAACYNDVDLGFKLLERGYRIVWTPDVRLRHFESLTRNPKETPAEADELLSRWGRRLGNDPFARQIDEWWAEAPFLPPPDPNGTRHAMTTARAIAGKAKRSPRWFARKSRGAIRRLRARAGQPPAGVLERTGVAVDPPTGPPPRFDAFWYLQNNPDVASAGIDPWVHYERHGRFEGRSPHALFDRMWYVEQYPDAVSRRPRPVHRLGRRARQPEPESVRRDRLVPPSATPK